MPHLKHLCKALNLLMESYSSHRCVRRSVSSNVARFNICFLHPRRHVREKVWVEHVHDQCTKYGFLTLPAFFCILCTVHLQNLAGFFKPPFPSVCPTVKTSYVQSPPLKMKSENPSSSISIESCNCQIAFVSLSRIIGKFFNVADVPPGCLLL